MKAEPFISSLIPYPSSLPKCPRQESNLVYDLRKVACVRHTPRTTQVGTRKWESGTCFASAFRVRTSALQRAGGGIRTHIDRITGAAPFFVEPHRQFVRAGSVSDGLRQQGRKDSNPVRLFWRQFALPGARPCYPSLSGGN